MYSPGVDPDEQHLQARRDHIRHGFSRGCLDLGLARLIRLDRDACHHVLIWRGRCPVSLSETSVIRPPGSISTSLSEQLCMSAFAHRSVGAPKARQARYRMIFPWQIRSSCWSVSPAGRKKLVKACSACRSPPATSSAGMFLKNFRLTGRDAGDTFHQERGRDQRHARKKPRDHPGGLDRPPERAVVDRVNRQPTQPQPGPLGLLLAQRGEPAFQPIVQVGSRIEAAVTD